jgi:hypothetical protein
MSKEQAIKTLMGQPAYTGWDDGASVCQVDENGLSVEAPIKKIDRVEHDYFFGKVKTYYHIIGTRQVGHVSFADVSSIELMSDLGTSFIGVYERGALRTSVSFGPVNMRNPHSYDREIASALAVLCAKAMGECADPPTAGDVWLVRYVLVPSRATAERIRAKVEKGMRLAEAAQKIGASPAPAAWYKKGALQMPLEDAVSGLKEGGCTVVETESGFFVVVLLQRVKD